MKLVYYRGIQNHLTFPMKNTLKKFSLTNSFLLLSSFFLLAGAGCAQQSTVSQQTNPTPSVPAQPEYAPEPTPPEQPSTQSGSESTQMNGSLEPNVNAVAEVKNAPPKSPPPAEKKSVGTYEDYAPSKIALAQNQTVVLFFYAPWCPTCKAVDTDIRSELSAIPSGLHILKVDYDTQLELKKKYGVTYQHTFVQIDAQGNMIKKWSGGNTLESVIQKLQ